MSYIATVKTVVAELHMAGDYDRARAVLNAYCASFSGCFSIWKTDYIYTGGEEQGFTIRAIHYPRFPIEDPEQQLVRNVRNLAMHLLVQLNQRSFTIVGPDETFYYSNKPEDLKNNS